jgi:NitT/TauT family transport system substrate-binding protein
MKKRTSFAVIVLALIMVFTFAACSKSTPEPAPAPEPAAPAEEPAAEEPAGPVSVKPDIHPEKTDIAIGHLNSTAHLLAFVAKEEGYFEEEGLNAELNLFASAAELVAGLESDKLDVALIGSVPTLTFQSSGHDITVFGGAMTNGHGYVIKPEFTEGLSEWDINILKGRNVASVKNSVQDLELLVLLDQNGIEIGTGPEQANVVYFDSQKDAFTALASAEIDAASVYSPYASLAQDQGYEVVYYCNEVEAFHNQPCCRQVALTTAIAERPDTYLAIERALIKAYKFSQENHDKTVEDVKVYIDIDPEFINYEVYGGHAESNPDPDKNATVNLKKNIVDFGYTEDYDIESLYNIVVYQTALESLIAEFPGDKIYEDQLTRFNSSDL